MLKQKIAYICITANDDIITLKLIIYNFTNSKATNTAGMHVNYEVTGPIHTTSCQCRSLRPPPVIAKRTFTCKGNGYLQCDVKHTLSKASAGFAFQNIAQQLETIGSEDNPLTKLMAMDSF